MKDLRSIEIFDCRSLEEVILDDLHNLVWLDIFVGTKSHMCPSMKGLVSLQVLKLCGAINSSNGISTAYVPLGLLQDCTSLLELEIRAKCSDIESGAL